MIAFKLGFRSFVRRGWGLLFVIAPAALLFSMLTLALATEASVQELAKPGIIDRAIRLGGLGGYPQGSVRYQRGEVNKFATIPGVSVAPASFTECSVDQNKTAALVCGAANRTYLQIHDYAIHISDEEFDRWDAVKNGAIVVRRLATMYHWKVGDPIRLHRPGSPDLELVVTSISDKYLEQNEIYYHNEYREQVSANVTYWVVWLLVDKAEHRQAVMEQIDSEMNSVHRPHTIWKGEDTLKLLLGTSKTLTDTFMLAGAVALLLVVCLAVTLLIVSIEQRRTELAVLMAVGFRRALVASSVLVEGVLLMSVAASIGAFGMSLLFREDPLVFDVVVSVKVPLLLAGIVTGGGMLLGLLSAAIPAWRSLRLDVLSALRE